MVMYHGSRSRISALDREIFLTADYAAAAEYATDDLQRHGTDGQGLLYTVEISDALRIADEDELWKAAGGRCDTHQTWELVADEHIIAALAERGYGAIRFDDQITSTGHDTVLVWATDHLTITDVETVEACS